MEELREKLGIPAEWRFNTKIELGWEMIQHACGMTYLSEPKNSPQSHAEIERNISGL